MHRREGYHRVSGDRKQRTLVVAAICFPPVLVGPSVLMGNLFRYFPEGSYHVLMGRLDHVWPPIDKDSMLQAPYTFTRYPLLQSGGNWHHRIRSFLRDMLAFLEVTWKGLRIIRQEKIDTIFVVADHYVELAALIMHRLTGKKVVLWLPDVYYVPENLKGWTRSLDRIIEPFLLRAVDTVLVTAEPTQEYYKDKYGIETKVLPHSAEINKYNKPTRQSYHGKIIRDIIYTGGFTIAQQGPIIDLVNIISEFPDLDIRFILYAIEPSYRVEEMGISSGPRIVIRQAERDRIPALQQSADILFLPFSFPDHGYSHHTILRTASPSKLPEYLAAGRPILVYAPDYTYYSRYARREGFGLVVDQPDSNLLREAIIKLKNDHSLCEELAANARRVAKEYHDAVKVSAILQNIIL